MNLNLNTQQAYQLLHNGILALARAEQQGIRVDVEYVQRKKQHLTRKIIRLEKQFRDSKFYKHWGHSTKNKININSNAQLGIFLYKVKKLTPTKLTTTGQGSTDEEALLLLNIPELNDLLEIRKLKKVRDTYLDAFNREQVNGYIHPFFNLHLVKTFRSSSSNPNFQNIPVRDEEAMQATRKALFPRPGHLLLEVDYKGLEVSIAACVTKDGNLIKYLKNPASDMHRDMAKQIFMLDEFDKNNKTHKILRSAAKNGFTFPEFYGDYYKNCAESLACSWGQLPAGRWRKGQGLALSESFLSDHLISKGIKSLVHFTEHLKEIEQDFWENRFPEYKIWQDRAWQDYQKYGYLDTLTGFRCGGVMPKNNVFNYPIQGPAFHCLLWSFVELDRIMQEEKWDTRLIGQIHDAIVLDVNPKELNHVVTVIKRVTCVDLPKVWDWICVPLSVDMDVCPVDGNWAEKKTLNI